MSKRIALITGSFHKKEADAMMDEARMAAKEHGLEIVAEVWVPGSMEKPLALKRLMLRDDVDGVAVLGIIEKGETSHGNVMAHAVVQAIIQLSLEYMKPVGTAILGPDIMPSQIPARIRPYARAAVVAVVKMFG
jgi:6,7-dimethyl-8-ribityllumazine synthase